MNHSEVLVIKNIDDLPVGFRMWSTIAIPSAFVVYLAGMCVHSLWQGKGVGQLMLDYVIQHSNNSHPEWTHMVLRTQNPIMQRCFAAIADPNNVYTFGDGDIPRDISQVVDSVAEIIGDRNVDAKLLVSRGVYGSSLYGKSYDLGQKTAGTNFAGLNQNAGDAAYCVWRK